MSARRSLSRRERSFLGDLWWDAVGCRFGFHGLFDVAADLETLWHASEDVGVLHCAIGVAHGDHETVCGAWASFAAYAHDLDIVEIVVLAITCDGENIVGYTFVGEHGEVHLEFGVVELDAIVGEGYGARGVDGVVEEGYAGAEVLDVPDGLVAREFAAPPGVVEVLAVLCDGEDG